MNTYPAYKHSGEQWLGQIPEHWEMRQWHFLLQENAEPNSDCKETQQLQFKYGEIVPKANQELDADTLKIIYKYTKVQPNDIMINGLNLNYDFISQRIGMVRCHGIITSAYISLRPTAETNPSYYNYLLKAMDAQKMFHGMGTGVRLTLSYKELKNKYLPFPPLHEQKAMVSYLDEQTGKIDQAIEREQKMIDLLEERKQIIIQQAVTKGLNPNAPMKDSGIDWIGEIPQSWKSIRLKYCMKIRNGQDYKHCVADFGYPVYGSGGQFAYASQYMYDGEVVFFGRKGTIDKPLYYKGKFWAVDTMFYAIPKKNIIGRFLYYAGRTIPFKYYSTSTALPSMTQTDLGNNPIALPPIEEQQNIVSYLDEKMGNIDRAIEAREKLISLLRERKQIIINEVVTGKIKVS